MELADHSGLVGPCDRMQTTSLRTAPPARRGGGNSGEGTTIPRIETRPFATRITPLEPGDGVIRWPVLPSPVGAKTLSVLYQLEESQWWDPETLSRHQLRQLAPVVAHARETVPVYRDRLPPLGEDGPEGLSPASWASVPVLTRAQAQEAGDRLRSTAVPADQGNTFPLMTSGSTGRPLLTVGTAVTRVFWNCLTLRDHLWHRRDFAQKLGVIRQGRQGWAADRSGQRTSNWGPATGGLVRTGPAALLSITHLVREQAEWLRSERPGYLLTYPSNAMALARHFSQRGERLPGLLEVRTFGEVLDPALRSACRQALGVPVVDMYSSQEVGYIALQCPELDHYHVQSENLLVEVLDGQGAPCGPGQIGQVVVTTLHNLATPLLRYALGDFAQVGEPCPCGRGLPVLTRILGRQRNMLTLPSGDQRWPTFGEPSQMGEATRLFARVRQFQVIQSSLQTLEVRLVVSEVLSPDEEEVVRDYVESTLGHRFELVFTYLDEIPRSKGGKFEDFRSEL